jgi:hypothetical protein
MSSEEIANLKKVLTEYEYSPKVAEEIAKWYL